MIVEIGKGVQQGLLAFQGREPAVPCALDRRINTQTCANPVSTWRGVCQGRSRPLQLTEQLDDGGSITISPQQA